MNIILLVPAFYLLPVGLGFIARKYFPAITSSAFLAATAAAVYHGISKGFGPVTLEKEWFHAGDAAFFIRLIADQTSVLLVIFSTLIASVVAIFSMSYMAVKDGQPRFFITLSLFMFFMTVLILSGDLLLSFFCWELIGLCSYLLIGFYRDMKATGRSAMKALLFNKVGDIGFMAALMGIWFQYGSFNLIELKNIQVSTDPTIQLVIGIGLLTAIIAKSAQFPLHGWLPDAMVGPSPVSALIHSATMVAAGVYLISRLHFLFPETVLLVAGGLGMVTSLLGAWNAFYQVKIKQVLAWSTISQLGLMLMSAGWGSSDAAISHLITHGFFKAGLFLVAGYLLKSINHTTENDLEAIAEIKNKDRLVAVATTIFALSLAGVPLSGSFITKEAIASSLPFNALIPFYVINSFTVVYTLRFLWILQPYYPGSIIKNLTGYTLPILFLLPFTGWWLWSVHPFHSTDYFEMTQPATSWITVLGISVFFASSLSAWWILRYGLLKKSPIINFDPLYHHWTIETFKSLFFLVSKIDRLVVDRMIHFFAFCQVTIGHLAAAADRYLIDGSVRGLVTIVGGTGNLIRKIFNGDIQTYLWWGLTAVLILVIWHS